MGLIAHLHRIALDVQLTTGRRLDTSRIARSADQRGRAAIDSRTVRLGEHAACVADPWRTQADEVAPTHHKVELLIGRSFVWFGYANARRVAGARANHAGWVRERTPDSAFGVPLETKDMGQPDDFIGCAARLLVLRCAVTRGERGFGHMHTHVRLNRAGALTPAAAAERHCSHDKDEGGSKCTHGAGTNDVGSLTSVSCWRMSARTDAGDSALRCAWRDWPLASTTWTPS